MAVKQIVTTGRSVPELAAYDRAMLGLMARWGLHGAALAVAKDGRLVLARGYGLANIEDGEPVQPQSLFRIASVSKPLTAMAILRLVEQGRLDLDASAFGLLGPPGAAAGRAGRSTDLGRHDPPATPTCRRVGP